mgnify:CR=1 FL=1|tara:strand:+ start:37953 stop:38453 length:501 start_codon:yes stop_codon:yes gene_type:complete
MTTEQQKPEQPQAHQTKLLSRDTNTAIKDVMDTITALGKVYSEETEALKKTDSQKFMDLQSKKIANAHEYQSVMAQMIARKNELKTADPATKDRLKKLHENFAEISQENLRAIERMQRTTERLGNTIRSAAIKAAQHQRGYSYSETGSIPNTSRKKAVSSGLSETV